MKRFLKFFGCFLVFTACAFLLVACSNTSKNSAGSSESSSSSSSSSGPSQKDYANAVEKFIKLKDAYKKSRSRLTGDKFHSGAEAQKVGKELADWRLEIEKELKSLGEEKAVKKDSEAQKKFLATQKSFDELKPGLISMEEYHSKVRVAYDFQQEMEAQNTLESMLAFYNQTITNLSQLKFTDSGIQQKVGKVAESITEYRDALQAFDGTQADAASKKITSSLNAILDRILLLTNEPEEKFYNNLNDLDVYLRSNV